MPALTIGNENNAILVNLVLENEMRESGKYKFTDLPSEESESEKDVFTSFVPIQLKPEEFEIIETLAKSRGISPENLIREWVLEHIEAG